MVEYLPWSKKTINECFDEYQRGRFPILDVELGGQCNYHCIYCDSPNREKRFITPIHSIEQAFIHGNIKWVFICGLGEPTVKDNKKALFQILQLCEHYNAKCSMFTNLSKLSSDLLEYIDKDLLYILFKCDSRDLLKNINLYGVPSVNRQLFNIDRIKKHVKVMNGCTNIAASIVPTRTNIEDVLSIVKDCLDCNIYPLIAELENSGDASEYYQQLAVSENELLDIKAQVDALIGETYKIPICPAVISGIHIRHDGNVTVDDFTGLSCHWFWLQEPKTKTVCSFIDTPFGDVIEAIKCIRSGRLPQIKSLLNETKTMPFGGCGGDVNELLRNYLEIVCKGGLK